MPFSVSKNRKKKVGGGKKERWVLPPPDSSKEITAAGDAFFNEGDKEIVMGIVFYKKI